MTTAPFLDFLTARDTLQTHSESCSCPSCTLLDCLERPRFFAGQVINETDLNDQIDYLRAKQRLHNRYLHGVGTVCGLEVVCNSCEGFVTIRPGYAISPCGDDIILCQEQVFDVDAAINACCNSRKPKTQCDPYRPITDPGCTGLEQRWCITIQYVETQTQAITPLRNRRKPACGCGCNSTNGTTSGKNGSACGCGASSAAPATTPVACEPTRILEGYQLGIVPDPGTCDSANTLYANTLFANLLKCVSQAISAYSQLPAASLAIVALAVSGNLPGSGTTDLAAYTACCQLRQLVLTIFATSSGVTACAAVSAFQSAVCPALPSAQSGPAGSNPQYLTSIQENILISIKAIFEALRECACHTLLPPCPPDPTDDRLILACLTVKDGVILDICNFGCRQFAGSFPSFFYWLSAVPIIPLLKRLVDSLCCNTEKNQVRGVAQARVVNRPTPFQSAFMESNFAMPNQFLQHLSDFAQKLDLGNIAANFPVGQLNLATLVGMKSQDAVQALNMHKLSFEQRAVNSRSEIPLSASAFIPFAKAGDHVVVYETGGSVVEAQRSQAVSAAANGSAASGATRAANATNATAATSTQAMNELRAQVASLQSDLNLLKRNAKAARNK